MRKILFLLWISFLGTSLLSQPHWESVVKADHIWNYYIGDAEPPPLWYSAGFDDSSWPAARGSFGFGDGDDTTILTISHSLYIRHSFTISDKSIIDKMILDIDFDDAFVVYLNGTMISRSFNVNADFPPFDYTPTIDQEAVMYQGGRPTRATIPVNNLLEGENIIAIQGINVNPTSSDFSLAPFLHVRIDADHIVYNDVPDWFLDPDAPFQSNLPIIVIDTENGAEIPDEPKITAHMGIISDTSGINRYPGTFNDYDGQIGIEIRGSSSTMFGKKGYGLETRLPDGTNNNVPLLGMPPENDWVLHGPYSDKSLIRNVLAYQFASEMGQYAPRTRLCELFLNDAYSGVYVLVEKIKKDTFRVDVGTLKPIDVSGRELTGGYIFKLDKGDEPRWTSPYLSINQNEINFLYHYPDADLMPTVQKDYIRNFVTNFENALAGSNFYDPVRGYKPYINEQSFVDYYLVNELTKNVDAYRISAYFHKDKDKLDRISPIKAGPVWDFNLGFGNADYYEASVTSGWQNEHPADYWSTPFWWARLKEDPEYFNLLVDSWKGYRSTILSDSRVEEVIDSLATMLSDAQQRNFNSYPVLSSYIWPNNYVGGTYANEISYLKQWIFNRMAWMDSKLDRHMYPYSVPANGAGDGKDIQIFPNPVVSEFDIHLYLDRGTELRVVVYNVLAQQTYVAEMSVMPGSQTLHFGTESVNQAMPETGVYYINLFIDGASAGSRTIIKQ